MYRRQAISLVIAATLILSGCFVNTNDGSELLVFNGNVFVVDNDNHVFTSYLIFCDQLTQKAVTTDSDAHTGGNGEFTAPDVSGFNFAKCQQVFVADNVNGNFVPVAKAQLTGNLGCKITFDDNDNIVDSDASGSAKLVIASSTSTPGHHGSKSPTPTTIETFSSAEGLECITGIVPFTTTDDTSVTATKLNEHAPQIKKLILKEAATRSGN